MESHAAKKLETVGSPNAQAEATSTANSNPQQIARVALRGINVAAFGQRMGAEYDRAE
ncbi:MAG: hypothetical protein AAF974_02720 [Cyanobacteria bacterium P01_E01_bin.34]